MYLVSDVVRDAPGIRIAGYARSDSTTNRANHCPSSTWASLCIWIDFSVYISVRLHALDSEPTRWCGSTRRTGACSSSLAMHGVHKLRDVSGGCSPRSLSFTVSNRNLLQVRLAWQNNWNTRGGCFLWNFSMSSKKIFMIDNTDIEKL